MRNNYLAEDIKRTGVAFRDWLTPYYTLGGAVAFCIAVFTLLDPSGQLVRLVAAGLFLLTVSAWVLHLSRRGASASQTPDLAKPPGVKLHAILLAITIFFLLGMLVSEALMRNKHASDADTVRGPKPASQTSEAVQSNAPERIEIAIPAASTPVELIAIDQPEKSRPASPLGSDTAAGSFQSQTLEPSALASKSLPAGQLDSQNEAAGAQTTSADTRALANKSKLQPEPGKRLIKTVDSSQNARSTATNAGTSTNAADRQRCSNLLSKFSLGEELRPHEKTLLETSCR